MLRAIAAALESAASTIAGAARELRRLIGDERGGA